MLDFRLYVARRGHCIPDACREPIREEYRLGKSEKPNSRFEKTELNSSRVSVPCSQFQPCTFRSRLSVDQNAPTLAAPSTGPANGRLEIIRSFLQDFVVKGAGLEPDALDPQLLSLLQDLNCDLGRCDDAHRGFCRVRQGR